eukprot:Gb_13329 [translate_table: standard]
MGVTKGAQSRQPKVVNSRRGSKFLPREEVPSLAAQHYLLMKVGRAPPGRGGYTTHPSNCRDVRGTIAYRWWGGWYREESRGGAIDAARSGQLDREIISFLTWIQSNRGPRSI